MKQDEIPLYYLFIYSKLKKKAWSNSYLDTPTILKTITHDCRQLPKNLIYHMLSHMEQYGLVKRIHRFRYKIIDRKIDLHGFDKKKTFYDEKDEFQKAICKINEEGKVKCEDISFYKLLPTKELRKLNELNCWFIKG